MARLSDLDDWTDQYIQFLKNVYFETDPRNGAESEMGKHTIAQLAIENFWYLHGKLLGWAQAHLTGYSILIENPKLADFLEEKLGHPLTEDSHELEQIGLAYNLNPADCNDPALERMNNLLDEFSSLHADGDEVILTTPAMRQTIIELLMSRCADNSYWRGDLQQTLAALNEGQADPLAIPSPGKRQGRPHSLNEWKQKALRHVHFLIGKGYKKYRALEEIGDAIGQSPETLRTWEKELRNSYDRAKELDCCELAGRFDSHFRGDDGAQMPNIDDFEDWRGVNDIIYAQNLHREIAKTKLDSIRDEIRRFRQKESGG